MQASKVQEQTLLEAAAEVGVRAEVETLNAKGDRHRVKLYPIVPAEALTPKGRRRKGEKGDARYQRESASYFSGGRRVHAVCWHGFRDFFHAVYRREPGAIFRTAFATYRGKEGFEACYRETGHRNIGSKMAPVMAAEACRCGEAGMAV